VKDERGVPGRGGDEKKRQVLEKRGGGVGFGGWGLSVFSLTQDIAKQGGRPKIQKREMVGKREKGKWEGKTRENKSLLGLKRRLCVKWKAKGGGKKKIEKKKGRGVDTDSDRSEKVGG